MHVASDSSSPAVGASEDATRLRQRREPRQHRNWVFVPCAGLQVAAAPTRGNSRPGSTCRIDEGLFASDCELRLVVAKRTDVPNTSDVQMLVRQSSNRCFIEAYGRDLVGRAIDGHGNECGGSELPERGCVETG